MKQFLPKLEQEKLNKILVIEEQYETGKLTLEEAKQVFAKEVGAINLII